MDSSNTSAGRSNLEIGKEHIQALTHMRRNDVI